MTKLNLGSGINGYDALCVITKNPQEWKCIDVCTHYWADEHYDISTGIREPDGSVEAIWMGDFFEHLHRAKAPFVLSECYRVMAPGGKLLISVPNMILTMRRWLASDGLDEGCANLIWGQQGEGNANPDSHYNGFTEIKLRKMLEEAGFTNIVRQSFHGVWFELGMMAVK